MVYDTIDELKQLGVINAEFKEALEKLNLPAPDYSDLMCFKKMVAEHRIEDIQAIRPIPHDIKKSERNYTCVDGTKMRALLYQPENPPKGGSPLICMYHGGGFCFGGPEDMEESCCLFVQAFGATCLSFSYRLAPEHKFPCAVMDSWDALKFAAENARSFGAEPSKGFIVGGTSAGGNITAVLSHMARDENLSPPLTGSYLSIPSVCEKGHMPDKYKDLFISYEQNEDVPVLPQVALNMFIGGYEPIFDDERFSVLLHPKGHSHLPPTYFQICGLDPLRDEALIYERILRQDEGIRTKLDVYPGLPHSFWEFLPTLKSSVEFRKDMVKGFGWLLQKEVNAQAFDIGVKEVTV